MQLMTIRAAGFTATMDACARDDGQVLVAVAAGEPAEPARPLGPPGQGRDRLPERRRTRRRLVLLAGRRGVGDLALLRRPPSDAAYHGLLVPELAAYACDRRDFLLLARREDEAPGVTEG